MEQEYFERKSIYRVPPGLFVLSSFECCFEWKEKQQAVLKSKSFLSNLWRFWSMFIVQLNCAEWTDRVGIISGFMQQLQFREKFQRMRGNRFVKYAVIFVLMSDDGDSSLYGLCLCCLSRVMNYKFTITRLWLIFI